MGTAEQLIRGALGLLSFIGLIVYLRWEGPWKDQKKDEPRSFTPVEIPHSDDPTDDARTNDDIGVERHL